MPARTCSQHKDSASALKPPTERLTCAHNRVADNGAAFVVPGAAFITPVQLAALHHIINACLSSPALSSPVTAFAA